MKKLIIVTLLFTFVASCVSSELNSLPNRMVVNLGSDEIILSSPDGYCINENTQRRHASGFSIILSDCFAISRTNSKMLTLVRSPVRATVSVTISDKRIRSDDDLVALDDLIMSGDFDSSFSRRSEIEEMNIVKRIRSNGVYYMCFKERSVISELESVSQSTNFCRAIFVLNQRIISLVGSDYSTQYSDNDRIEKLVKATALQILKANQPNEV